MMVLFGRGIGPLMKTPVINGQQLVDCMAPIEVGKPNDIEVLIELLECLLEPENLGLLSSGTLQAILRDALTEVSHVEVTPELVLRVVFIGGVSAEHRSRRQSGGA